MATGGSTRSGRAWSVVRESHLRRVMQNLCDC